MHLARVLSDPAWQDRFATRLGRLIPNVTPEAAYAFGVETLPAASDLTPEEAAEIFAVRLPPPVGAPDE